MKNILVCTLLTLCALNAGAQITIERGAIFQIQDNASVTLLGDLFAWNNIEGGGYLELASKQATHIDINGFHISNLVLRSPATLESDVTITSSIILQGGPLNLHDHNIVLDQQASIAGGEENYIQATGVGMVKKIVSGRLSNYKIPLGTSTSYMPLQISTGTKHQNGAVIVSARESISDHKPLQVRDYLKQHWIIQQEGNLDNLIVTGYYRLTDVEGNPENISAFFWDGYSWKAQSHQNKSGNITARITSPAGELYAMNDMININTGMKLLNNPARSYTILQISSPVNKSYHVVLRDVMGRQLQVTDLKVSPGIYQHTVYLNGLSQGTYFLDIGSGTEKQTFKFLKVQ